MIPIHKVPTLIAENDEVCLLLPPETKENCGKYIFKKTIWCAKFHVTPPGRSKNNKWI